MGKRKRRKPKLHHDDRGEFRWETYFVGGKQKRTKVRTVDGMDADEFYRRNATEIELVQDGRYELLHGREQERDRMNRIDLDEAEDAEIDIPF